MAHTMEDIDNAIKYVVDNQGLNIVLADDEYYQLNRPQFISMCIRKLWLNGIPSDYNEHTMVLFDAATLIDKTGFPVAS